MTSQDELTRHNIFRCAVLDQSPISYLFSDFEEGLHGTICIMANNVHNLYII